MRDALKNMSLDQTTHMTEGSPPISNMLRLLHRVHSKQDSLQEELEGWASLFDFMQQEEFPFKTPTDEGFSHFLKLKENEPLDKIVNRFVDDNIGFNTFNQQEKDVVKNIITTLFTQIESRLSAIKHALDINTFPNKWNRRHTETLLNKFTQVWVPLFHYQKRAWILNSINQFGLKMYVLKTWLAQKEIHQQAWKKFKNIQDTIE